MGKRLLLLGIKREGKKLGLRKMSLLLDRALPELLKCFECYGLDACVPLILNILPPIPYIKHVIPRVTVV